MKTPPTSVAEQSPAVAHLRAGRLHSPSAEVETTHPRHPPIAAPVPRRPARVQTRRLPPLVGFRGLGSDPRVRGPAPDSCDRTLESWLGAPGQLPTEAMPSSLLHRQ